MAVKRLVVIGGGISGLAAAWGALDFARKANSAVEVLVLEREADVGGKVRSIHEDGYLVEAGPGGFLDNEPAVRRLIAGARMNDEVLPANEAAANRYIVRDGRMRLVDPHPIRFARSGLLGAGGMLRLLGEPFIKGRRDESDETVWDFAARRIGPEAANQLIAPMVLGVFAGDAKRLSLPAAFPKMATLEREHGSLVRGMLAKRKEPSGGPAGPAGKLTSFRGGLHALPAALAAIDDLSVECDSAVEAVTRSANGSWELRVADRSEPIPADAVVFSGEPWAMAPLLRPHGAELADRLDGILCPPVTVMALGFGPQALDKAPVGFGVLIPRGEGFRILGCLWETHLFPGRSPHGRLLVRVMLGGAVDPEVTYLPDDELVSTVRDDLKRLMNIGEPPIFQRIVRWPRAIPQYELGHLDRVAAIEWDLGRLPGLFIAGNAMHGIAFAKAATTGVCRGEEAARWLLSQH